MRMKKKRTDTAHCQMMRSVKRMAVGKMCDLLAVGRKIESAISICDVLWLTREVDIECLRKRALLGPDWWPTVRGQAAMSVGVDMEVDCTEINSYVHIRWITQLGLADTGNPVWTSISLAGCPPVLMYGVSKVQTLSCDATNSRCNVNVGSPGRWLTLQYPAGP